MTDTNDDAEALLELWLGPGDVPDDARKQRWWTKDPAFDDMLRQRFGALLERAARGELDAWTATARGALALVVLLDQLSRNVHRGTPRAFAADARARDVMRGALARGLDRELPHAHRVFLYMPLMHSEDLADQREALARFTDLADTAPAPLAAELRGNLDYARRHLEIVERFGRFPHRNAILGRESTPEEQAFLQQPGSSF